MEVSELVVIYCDNLRSIQQVKNPVFHARMKHIEVLYHFVREWVLSGKVELAYVSTYQQVVDIFTKPLGLDKLCHDNTHIMKVHDTHIMTRKDLNPWPCCTHVKSLTIVLIFLYV